MLTVFPHSRLVRTPLPKEKEKKNKHKEEKPLKEGLMNSPGTVAVPGTHPGHCVLKTSRGHSAQNILHSKSERCLQLCHWPLSTKGSYPYPVFQTINSAFISSSVQFRYRTVKKGKEKKNCKGKISHYWISASFLH